MTTDPEIINTDAADQLLDELQEFAENDETCDLENSQISEIDHKKLLETLLFVAYEPMEAKKLAEIMEIKKDKTLDLLKLLQLEYQNKGFNLVEIAGGWQFLTNEEYAIYIERLYNPRNQQLSKAALETLAIIAYRQPITKLEIESIRQVKSDAVVNKLMDKDLVKEVGRGTGAGRPILYGTSNEFLSFFGIDTLKDLPPLAEKEAVPSEISLFDNRGIDE